ncbi:MAG: 50S ribosomal protein L4 [Actinomycetota bacterium]|nr:50S ribosomal protein L4 [Actinomycetota bacterium]
MDGRKSRRVSLPAEIFGVQPNISLMHQVVVAQLAAKRQGTSSTKTRGEVRGGGAKPYRQKGTGRARQGSIRAPQFEGGGIVFGPTPRSYAQRTPKKMKAAALRCALSDRAASDRLHVVTGFVEGDAPSTKSALAVLSDISSGNRVLVVALPGDDLTRRSLRNLGQVHLIAPGQLNTHDVLVSDDVIFTEDALEVFLAGPTRGKSASARATEAEVTEADEDPAEREGASTERQRGRRGPTGARSARREDIEDDK